MRILALVLLSVTLAACDTTVSKKEMSSVDYGPEPTRWKEEIRSYLAIRLTDPKDAIVEYRTEPKQIFQRKTPVRDKHWGWGVCVWVNDRTRPAPGHFAFPDDLLHP
jgi:hypothetical protein